jgi:hypothetical protein
MQSPLPTGPTLTCATATLGTTTRPPRNLVPVIPNGVLSVPCEHPGCDHKYQSHYDDESDENPCIAETPIGRRLRVSTPPDLPGSPDCARRRIANLVINAEGNRTEIEIWHETKRLDDWPGYTTPERWTDAGVPETRSRSPTPLPPHFAVKTIPASLLTHGAGRNLSVTLGFGANDAEPFFILPLPPNFAPAHPCGNGRDVGIDDYWRSWTITKAEDRPSE